MALFKLTVDFSGGFMPASWHDNFCEQKFSPPEKSTHDLNRALQKYITDIFTANFAYETKFALEGKKLILSFTCGGGEKSYTKDGLYHCTIDEIMLPVYATARYCKMDFIGNVISYHMMPEDCPKDKIIEKAKNHADELAQFIH